MECGASIFAVPFGREGWSGEARRGHGVFHSPPHPRQLQGSVEVCALVLASGLQPLAQNEVS